MCGPVAPLGSSADPIVGQFAISYHNEAAALGIDLDELFAAQIQDGEVTPPEWNIEGRQIGVYKCGVFSSSHLHFFEVSREI